MNRKILDIKAFLDHALPRVSKPGRYIGGEVNAVLRTPAPSDIRVALAFPEAYEIGMSHGGLSILYHVLNATPGVYAERVFAPFPDMENEMRRASVELFSLETKTPIRSFDLVGFSVMYELVFTNIVSMLSLSRIPILSQERGDAFPILIAGGASMVNPEPCADIFDAVVIGDGEEVIGEIIDVLKHYRNETGSKGKMLNALDEIEGIYVPRFFEPVYEKGEFSRMVYRGKNGGGESKRVKRRVVKNLDQFPFPSDSIVPSSRAVHDRISVEIARGCGRGCRFCQAGFIYRPVRERGRDAIVSTALSAVEKTGMEEVSLLSLSSGDFSCIVSLMRDLMNTLEEKRVALSVPSLRADTLGLEIIKEIQKVRKTGFTIAPEAGSQRLRDVINKNITTDEIEKTVDVVFSAGWQLLKLYFMIGLPTETEEDLEGIIDLIERLSQRSRGGKKRGMNIGVSVFVPKPHTPFQWDGQISINEIRHRQNYIRSRLRSKTVALKFHGAEMGSLEGAFSRGDRRLVRAVIRAWELGCRFDGWGEHFNFDAWERAFHDVRLSIHDYAQRTYRYDEPLPWEHIDARISSEYLKRERENARAGIRTADCVREKCEECGVCDGDINNSIAVKENLDIKKIGDWPLEETRDGCGRFSYLLFYSRAGNARFISHLETMTAITRALARSNLPISFSTGFHPKPRVSFFSALPVGVACEREPFAVELFRELPCREILESLQGEMPEGMKIEGAFILSEGMAMHGEAIDLPTYEVVLDDAAHAASVGEKIGDFMKKDEAWSSDERKKVDLRPFVEKITMLREDGSHIALFIRNKNGSSPSPYRVIGALLGIPEGEARAIRVIKRGAYEATAG